MTSPHLSRRSLTGIALAGAAALAATGTLPASRAHAADSADSALPPLDTRALQAALDDLEHPPATAAQLKVAGSAGRWYGTSGVADVRTGRPVQEDDRIRIGSVTKVFVATVALQLVAERRLDLATPVQRLLPGLLPDRFAPITLAQLLNHTSGLPDHVGLPELDTPEQVFRHRFDHWTPERFVETATRRPLKFAPGTCQEYRGVNYVLAALLIERITGRPYGEAVTARLLRPLRLTRTSVPGDDPRIHGPHVHGYLRMTDGRLRDVTTYDMSASRGEGDMISTPKDLDRLLSALFSGVLLPPRLLAKMFTLPPPEVRMLDGTPARYSTGLQTATVNGIALWGKSGEHYGYKSVLLSTRDQQRRVVISGNPTTLGDGNESRLIERVLGVLTRR
ncbi:serine hydrolase domain-containing protein [Streptomyces sp. bgisy100]|uniref:serine hydrolase domain-containing protein n=1 Tax=Streptomyces sp. bgisy100 TaxID=3413783 RepID=UPI003D7528F4